MKSLLFFVVVIGIALVAYTYSPKKKEGFQDTAPPGASPGLNIPDPNPQPSQLVEGEPQPFAPPSSELLAPPPGQLASVTTLPFEDPALEKAPFARIKNLVESLTAFMNHEAPGLNGLGDPAVQLPIATARADLTRVRDELSVLNRNPGVQSMLTQEDANAMEANLGFLQRKWRQSANRLSADSPMPPEYDDAEGFEDWSPSVRRGWISWLFGSWMQEGFQTTGGSTGDSTGGSTGGNTGAVTIEDLRALSTRLGAEVIRLTSSGTTDPLITERADTYTKLQKTVDDYIAAIQKGTMNVSEINIKKDDITRVMGVITAPTGSAAAAAAAVTGVRELQNLFELSSDNDPQAAKKANEMMNKYLQNLLNNLSWSATLNYTSEAEKDMAKNLATTTTSLQTLAGMEAAAGSRVAAAGAAPADLGNAAGSVYAGLFQSVIKSLTGVEPSNVQISSGGRGISGSGGGSTVPTAGVTAARASTDKNIPSPFDWKQRGNQICQQITARGLDAKEFGCLEDSAKVSDGFSWRGYTRMVCTRLGTMYDPSIPEACGCPPFSWVGWRQ